MANEQQFDWLLSQYVTMHMAGKILRAQGHQSAANRWEKMAKETLCYNTDLTQDLTSNKNCPYFFCSC